mgnify:CR=1 FL=1
MKLQLPRSAYPDVIAGLSLLLALTGGLTWIVWRTSNLGVVMQPRTTQIEQSPNVAPNTAPTAPRASTPQVPQVQSPPPQPMLERSAQMYWLQASGQTIEMVPVPMSRTAQQSDTVVLTKAFNYLLSHPQLDQLSSTIPQGTRLLNLQVKPDGIHLNLSQEFTQGGGTASMTYRVAQVLYTATSLDPEAKVYLAVEGKLLNENNPLGGEGLMLQQPMTRQQFVKEFLAQEDNT